MTATKRQLSLTVSAELVGELERSVRDGRYPNRSAAVEAALRAWSKQQRSAELHAYYDRLGPAERAEEEQWAELGRRALAAEPRTQRRTRRRR